MSKGRSVVAMVCGVLAFWALILLATWVFQDKLVYPFVRDGAFLEPPQGFTAVVVEGGAVVLATSVGGPQAVRAWRAEPSGAPRGRVLFLVGNGGTPWMVVDRASLFRDAGWDVAIAVYPGTVGTPGAPTQEGMERLAGALVDAWSDAPPLVYGYSMGGALSVRVAATHPVAGLFLEAPLADLWPLARRAAPWVAPFPFLLRDRWDALSVAAGVRVPAWVVHGSADQVVPADQGAALARALGAGFHTLPGGRHGDLTSFGLLEGVGSMAWAGQDGWWDAARVAYPDEGAVSGDR